MDRLDWLEPVYFEWLRVRHSQMEGIISSRYCNCSTNVFDWISLCVWYSISMLCRRYSFVFLNRNSSWHDYVVELKKRVCVCLLIFTRHWVQTNSIQILLRVFQILWDIGTGNGRTVTNIDTVQLSVYVMWDYYKLVLFGPVVFSHYIMVLSILHFPLGKKYLGYFT